MAKKTEQPAEKILFRSPRRGFRAGVPGRQPYKRTLGGDEWEWVKPDGHTIKFIPYQKSRDEMMADESIKDPWGSEYVAEDPVEIEALRTVCRRDGADICVEVGPVADPMAVVPA